MSRKLAARVTLGAMLTTLSGLAISACSSDGSGSSQTAGGSAGTTSSAGTAVQPSSGSSSGGSAHSGSASGGTESKAGSASGASGSGSGGSASGGGSAADPCAAPGLTWKSARKTWYTSYPDPGSEECIKYNGCTWAGQFSACEGKKPEAWVQAHNIVAAFPDYDTLALHDLCLKSGDKTLVVTVLDTCGDDDCDGLLHPKQGQRRSTHRSRELHQRALWRRRRHHSVGRPRTHCGRRLRLTRSVAQVAASARRRVRRRRGGGCVSARARRRARTVPARPVARAAVRRRCARPRA